MNAKPVTIIVNSGQKTFKTSDHTLLEGVSERSNGAVVVPLKVDGDST